MSARQVPNLRQTFFTTVQELSEIKLAFPREFERPDGTREARIIVIPSNLIYINTLKAKSPRLPKQKTK